MGIWHKTLDDAQKAYNNRDFKKAHDIIKEHSNSMGEDYQIFGQIVHGFDEYKKRVWKLAHFNLAGNIDQDREWLELLKLAEASLNQTTILLGQLYSKLKKE